MATAWGAAFTRIPRAQRRSGARGALPDGPLALAGELEADPAPGPVEGEAVGEGAHQPQAEAADHVGLGPARGVVRLEAAAVVPDAHPDPVRLDAGPEADRIARLEVCVHDGVADQLRDHDLRVVEPRRLEVIVEPGEPVAGLGGGQPAAAQLDGARLDLGDRATGGHHVPGRISKRSLTPAISRRRRTLSLGTSVRRRPEPSASCDTSIRLRRPTEPKNSSPRRSTTTAPFPRSRAARIAALASSTVARSSSPSRATVISPASSVTRAVKRSPASGPASGLVGMGRERSRGGGRATGGPRLGRRADCDEPMTAGPRLPARGGGGARVRGYGRSGPHRGSAAGSSPSLADPPGASSPS